MSATMITAFAIVLAMVKVYVSSKKQRMKMLRQGKANCWLPRWNMSYQRISKTATNSPNRYKYGAFLVILVRHHTWALSSLQVDATWTQFIPHFKEFVPRSFEFICKTLEQWKFKDSCQENAKGRRAQWNMNSAEILIFQRELEKHSSATVTLT